MFEIEEIYDFIPQGMFIDVEEFVSYVNENGVQDFYEFMPEGMFATQEEFVEGLKKKDAIDPSTGLELDAGGSVPSEIEIPTQASGQRNVVSPVMGFQKEKDTAIERAFGKNEVTDFFGDMYRSYQTGVAQGATVDDAYTLFSKGQEISDNDLTDYINAVQEMSNTPPSEEMQDFSKIYNKEGKGIYGFLKGIYENPTVAPQLFISSLVSMFNPASAAAGAAGALTGAGTGAAATAYFGPGSLIGAGAGAIAGAMGGMSGALETGIAYTEFLQEELGEKGLSFDQDGIRKILEDKDAMGRIRNRALGRGITIGAIDALTAGLASKVTIGTATKLAKGAKSASRFSRGARDIAAVAAGGAVEAVGGSAGETAARVVAGQELDVAEIGFEGIAGTATAPLTVLAQLAKKPSYTLNGGRATRKDIELLIKKGSDIDILAVESVIKNDLQLETQLENKKNEIFQRLTRTKEIKEVAPDITEADLKQALRFQREITKLEANPSEAAKEKLKLVKKLNKNLLSKYIKDESIQKPGPEGVPVQKSTEDSQEVGRRDDQPTESTQETTQAQEETTVEPTQENQVKVEEKDQKERLKDNQVVKSAEVFDVDMDGNSVKVEVKTNLDGSREVIMTTEEGVVKERLSKDNPIPNTDYVTKAYGEIKGSKSRPITEVMSQKKIDRLSTRQKDAIGLNQKTTKQPKSQLQKEPLIIGEAEVIFNENQSIKEIRNKINKKPVSKKRKLQIEKQLLRSKIDVNAGTEATITEDTTQDEINRTVAEESNNIRQIADALRAEQKQRKQFSAEERINAFDPNGYRFLRIRPEDWQSYGDNNKLTPTIKRRWLSEEALPIEISVSELSNYNQNNEKEIIEEVIEFAIQNPSRPTQVKNPKTPTEIDLEVRFEELTGIKPTDSKISEVLKIDPSRSPLEEVKETDTAKSQEALESDERVFKNEERVQKEFKKEIKDKVNKSVEEMTPAFDGITENIATANNLKFARNVKAAISGRGRILEGIRSTPLTYVDQTVGINNSTIVYDKVFKPVIDKYEKVSLSLQEIIQEMDAAKNSLERKGADANQTQKDAYEIGLYLIAREHEANKGSKIAPPPIDLLTSTINAIDDGLILSPLDGVALQELLDKYDVDGEITVKNIEKGLSKKQLAAAKKIIALNNSLYSRAKAASQRRGIPFVTINDYVHRQVLMDKEAADVDVVEKSNKFADPSTFGGSIIERKEGSRAIQFDPFESAKRGAQETLIDFELTPAVTEVQQLTTALKNKYKTGNKGQKDGSIALGKALRELLRITYMRTYQQSNNNITNKVINEITRIAYRQLLSSAPRFMAELIGNASMLVAQDSEVITNAYSKYLPVWSKVGTEANDNFIYLLKNLESTESLKLAGRLGQKVLDTDGQTKYSDENNFLNLSESSSGMRGPVAQKMDYIASLGPKQAYKVIAKASDFLMGGADRVIARPIWVSKFAYEFKNNVKKINKEDIDLSVKDFQDLSKKDSKSIYLNSKYKKALKAAVSEADRTSFELVTSGSPLNGMLKNMTRIENRSSYKNLYRKINSFMANFTLNEYATARFAIGALTKEGKISKEKAGLLLGGVLARMSSYVVLYKLFADFMDQLFGAPEDEEERYDLFAARQMLGAVSTLMFRQNLGNIPSLPINLGIEYLNKNYLQKLRDGADYNSYENSIVLSLINLDQLGKKSIGEISLPIIAGPFGPLYRTLDRTFDLAVRTQTRKTQAAKDRAAEELTNRMTFEAAGQLGLIPFYKDARRIVLKKRFAKDNEQTISKKQLKKIAPKLYKQLYGN